MRIQPYLFFDGRCEEAVTFYRDKLGAEITMLMRFGDNPEKDRSESGGCGGLPHGSEDKDHAC